MLFNAQNAVMCVLKGFLMFKDFCENVSEEAVPQLAFYEEVSPCVVTERTFLALKEPRVRVIQCAFRSGFLIMKIIASSFQIIFVMLCYRYKRGVYRLYISFLCLRFRYFLTVVTELKDSL